MKSGKILVGMLIFLVAGVFASSTFAAVHYVRAGATGNGSGRDWTNAYTRLPSNLVRGDTYYVADGKYPGRTFGDALSGSAYITIKKAIPRDHGTDVGWSDSFGAGTALFGTLTFNTGYYIFDGQVGTGLSNSYGFKVAYSGTGYRVKLISFYNTPSHITIKHVDMQHAGAWGNNGHDIIYIPNGASHLRISHSYLHDVGRCPIFLRAVNDSVFEHLYVARNQSNSEEHAQGVSALTSNRIVFAHCTWEDIEGTSIITLGYSSDWKIYGNKFFYTPNYKGTTGNGAVAGWTKTYVHNAKVYNNTFYNLKGFNTGVSFPNTSSTGNEAYNNIWSNCGPIGFMHTKHDYNFYCDNNPSVSPSREPNIQLHTGDCFVNTSGRNFRLAIATKNGRYLSSPYDLDPDGVTRGSDGIWDRGAFEFGGVVKRPEAPLNLRVVEQ